MPPFDATTIPARELLDTVLEQEAVLSYYQPIISVRRQAITGFESLSRGYFRETGNVVAPVHLFRAAKELGRTVELDRLCLKKAMASFENLFKANPDFTLSLNLSMETLREHDYHLTFLWELCSTYHVQPAAVVLDVDDAAFEDEQTLARFLDAHHERGFMVAFDRVGLADVSFERLITHPPDIIKLDRTLLKDINTTFHQQEAVKCIVRIAQKVGADVTAIGIENTKEALTVLEYGVHTMQGYYFDQPNRSSGNLMQSYSRQIGMIREEYRKRALARISTQKERFNTVNKTIANLIFMLVQLIEKEFEPELRASLIDDDNFEYLFILDAKGTQIIEPMINPRLRLDTGPPRTLTRKGDSHSLTDYVLFLDSGYKRFVTEPAISPVSGQLGQLMTIPFMNKSKRKYVLCMGVNTERAKPSGD